MPKSNRAPGLATQRHPVSVTPNLPHTAPVVNDPLGIEAIVNRVFERRWDDLLTAVGERQTPPYLNTSGVCSMLQISPALLKKLIDQGLPCIRLSEVRRFDPEAVRQWVAQKGQP